MPNDPARLEDHYIAAVCEQGHLETARLGQEVVVPLSAHFEEQPVTSDEPITRYTTPPRCGKCGSNILTECPHCKSPLRGAHVTCGFVSVASFCWSCGEPYPWTESQKAAVFEMLDLIVELNDEEREKLKESFPDLISESPRQGVATLRWAKAVGALPTLAKNIIGDALRGVVTSEITRRLFEPA